MKAKEENPVKRADVKLILPTILAVALFVISIFAIIIPAFRSNIMDRKREMIRELTNSAWSVMQEYAVEEKKGNLTRQEAQKRAVSDIRFLRYGEERKDYFWITDMHPRMVMHPYRPNLDGQSLHATSDPTGKKLFVEMVEVCKENDSGFIEYMWQWKDDPTRIVPKLSYVKRFQPWDWIIGTGIYIEDVKEEISGMTGRLISISIVIIVLIALLLFYITQQSLKIEKQRYLAEQGLKESEKKYRALVEASTEGTMMAMESRYIYSNQPILNLLEYTSEEFRSLNLYDIIVPDTPGAQLFSSIMEKQSNPSQFEAVLKKKNGSTIDVELNISNISLGDEQGFIIIARDIARNKKIEEELGQSKEKYKALTNNLNIGVFRTTIGRKGRFVEANPAAVRILGFESEEDLYKTTLFDLFDDKLERLKITKELLREGFLRDRMLEIRRTDGSLVALSISCVLVKDENGENRYCDGIVEDITERKKIEESRENLIVELQSAQLYFNQSVKHFFKDITRCSMNTSIRKAAALMTKKNFSAILVTADPEEIDSGNSERTNEARTNGLKTSKTTYIGIVTDRDLRGRVLADGIDMERPIYEVMSAPIISIPDSALVFEAMLLMQENSIRHLAVKDHSGTIASLISNEQLIQMQRSSSAFLIKEIHDTESVEDIVIAHNRLPRLVKSLIESGANSKNICRIITSISDAIVERIIGFALEEQGPPPVDFAFMALGSEGRKEQTLLTDQDNAIIYEDTTDPGIKEEARKYFLKLGNNVCQWLHQSGYKLCAGDVMAQNPKWCQPLSGWKKHFRSWINAAAPQDLLEVNIFFDFRSVFGKKELTAELRKYIDELLKGRPEFFQFIARNALLYKPPIGFFGNIVLDSSGENPSTFDIKEAMKPIVNFARLYALKNNIEETNTQDRLYRLFVRDILNKSSYEEIVKVYDYLMQMRFKHQANALNENRKPDNFINPKNLTEIEHTLLKNTFSQINNFQKRLSYDFTGSA
jgi:PAS domain S-box-containing protein